MSAEKISEDRWIIDAITRRNKRAVGMTEILVFRLCGCVTLGMPAFARVPRTCPRHKDLTVWVGQGLVSVDNQTLPMCSDCRTRHYAQDRHDPRGYIDHAISLLKEYKDLKTTQDFYDHIIALDNEFIALIGEACRDDIIREFCNRHNTDCV